MISMVVPYWKRGSILKASLQRYKELYPRLSLEILVVDDGSPEPATIDDDYPWPVTIVRLPAKNVALNPCVPFNAGASAANGDILVLTNPEIIHRGPILEEMAAQLAAIGTKGYIAAACQAASGVWYCHSTKMPSDAKMGRAPSPPGAGLHFCAMLGSDFYDDLGGFSEEYRLGQAYDDNDFLWKLHRAGAEFRILDDCVTEHMDCPRCVWPAGGIARNKKIFEDKWLTSPSLQN